MPITIDALGLNTDIGGSPSGQIVRIYVDGKTTTLVMATILSSDPISAPTANGHTYAYHAISPVTLLPNTTYDIVEDLSTGDRVAAVAALTSGDPNVTPGSGRFSFGGGAFPTSDSNGFGPYVGPTFEEVGPATAVPAPASLTLLGIGAVGLLGYGWRRRRQAA